MKLSEIIIKLQIAKKMNGNLDICFSGDEEGNNIMNTAEVSLYEKESGDKVICLFPYK